MDDGETPMVNGSIRVAMETTASTLRTLNCRIRSTASNGCNAFKFLTGRRITLHRWYLEGGHITISTPFFTSPLRRTSEAGIGRIRAALKQEYQLAVRSLGRGGTCFITTNGSIWGERCRRPVSLASVDDRPNKSRSRDGRSAVQGKRKTKQV
jgi:hypothetical protein